MSAARLINCPSCGGSIAIKAAGYSTTVACQYCGSELDVASPDVRLITEYHNAASAGDIPLGARGTVQGTEWEVIGRLERSDDGAWWTEYLLFNPYAGYRWLIQADDEWSLGTALNRNPVTEGADVVTFDGERFVLDYEPVSTRTNSVVGEFYWRVRAGDTVEATTFSSGSRSLSWERSADEVNWTLVEELPDGEAVRAAFQDPAPASPAAPAAGGGPRQFGRKAGGSPRSALNAQGLMPVRRASDADDLGKMVGIAIATSFLLLVIGMFFGVSRGTVGQSMTVYTGEPAKTMMLGTVTLKRPYQAVTVTARGDQFVNKWVDLDYSLVDRRTQQAIDAYGIVEYYAGRDSDGNWTEGSRRETTKFAGVPAGTYDVMVEAKATNWSSSSYSSSTTSSWASGDGGSGWGNAPESINLRFTITPGGVFFGNMLMFILLIFAPLAIWMWRKMQASKNGYRS